MMLPLRVPLFAAAAAVILAACAQAGAAGSGSDAAPDPAEGRKLVADYCGSCHAIGQTGPSPHSAAPPFREVTQLYAPENLEEALAEGIGVGHEDMPEFVFEPAQVEKIIAYLKTLNP